jgi:hypothetical protein
VYGTGPGLVCAVKGVEGLGTVVSSRGDGSPEKELMVARVWSPGKGVCIGGSKAKAWGGNNIRKRRSWNADL